MWLYNSHLWIKLWYCHRSFWAVWVALLAFHQVATQRSNVVFKKKSTLCPDNPDCFLSLNLWEYFFLIYLATLGLVSSANLCTFRVLVTALWAWHTLREEIFFPWSIQYEWIKLGVISLDFISSAVVQYNIFGGISNDWDRFSVIWKSSFELFVLYV